MIGETALFGDEGEDAVGFGEELFDAAEPEGVDRPAGHAAPWRGWFRTTAFRITLLHLALTGEVAFTIAKYQHESWEMGGVRLGLIVF